MEPVSPESSWPTEEESSDCGCRFSSSSVEETPRHSEAARLEPNQPRGREGAETGERSGVDDHDGVEEGDGPHRQLRAQLFMTANVVPLFRDRLPQLKKKFSLLWLYTCVACTAIVVAASVFLGPSAVAWLSPASIVPGSLVLRGGVRTRLGDDEHEPQRSADGPPLGEAAATPAADEPPMEPADPFCSTQLIQEREESWNESHFEFLSPRLVRNGSRAVLCFYDRRAHLLPPPYAFFPRQMAMRYCTHAVYHAPFALHEGRLAYRNPEFDRQFGLPELARVARRYGTHLLFTVGGEETDNANWSRLASNEKQRELLASDLTEALVSLGYDGVNLHWATPGGRCGRTGDAKALTDLVRMLRPKLRRPVARRDFLLAVTLPPHERFVEISSQITTLAKLADFLVLQAHSLYGPSSPWPRCASPYEAPQGPSVRALLDSLGARLYHGHWGKLCITQSLAAITYRLADQQVGGPGPNRAHGEGGDASVGPGDPQPVTDTAGKAAYFEVCGWARQRTRSRECSMLRHGSTVAALEGPDALRHKLARMSLDGHERVCIAALDTHFDDALGACGGPLSPLLKRLYEDPHEA